MTPGPERVAQRLHAEPPRLDDLGRARVERAVMASLRTAPEAPSPAPRHRWAPRFAVAAFVAATLATLAWWGLSEPTASPPGASPEPSVPSSLVAEGMPAQGETLRTGAGQRVHARIDGSEVGLEPNTRARFERIAQQELRVRLRQGALRVTFRPREDEQRMVVVTPAARVEVVGTVFRVEVDGTHATGVWVERGAVRVVPTEDEDTPRTVRAGDSTRVEPAGTVSVDVVDGLVEDAAQDAAEPTDDEGAAAEEPEPAASSKADGSPEARSETPRGRGRAVRRPQRAQVLLPGDVPSPHLARAQRLLGERKYEAARRRLRRVTESTSRSRAERTQAWVLIAESHEEQGRHAKAAEAYGKAAWFGSGTVAGKRALFMLAQIREGRLADARGARNAYRRYLRQFPDGSDAAAARRALCRLGACP